MNQNRLASIIFERGKKISQQSYSQICESVQTDKFNLNEYVVDYKKKDAIFEKVFFLLNDGTKILVSEETLNKLQKLNLNRSQLEEFAGSSKKNFLKVLEAINGDQ